MNADPSALCFETCTFGKPFVRTSRGISAAPFFSVSHSADLALITVTLDQPIGVDVERTAPIADLDLLIESCCAADERLAMPSNSSDKLSAFYRCWTRKEAMLKAAGLGLRVPLSSISVDCLDRILPRVRSVGPDLAPADQWSLVHLDPAPGFIGAIAATWPIRTIHRRVLEP